VSLLRALPLVATACSSDVPGAADAAPDVHHDAHFVVDSGVDEPTPAFTVTGRVVDSTGASWANAHMQICDTICYLGTAGADGVFTMGIKPTGTYAIDATGALGDGRSASRTVYARLIDQDVTLGDIAVYETGAGQTLTSQKDVAIDGDLTLLAVDPSALTLSGNVTTPYAAGIRVQKATFPTYDTQGKTVVAMWALNPFATKSSKPIAVTIKNSFGLAAGAKLAMRAVDDVKGQLLAEVPLTVSTDAMTITTDSGGVDRLTWIVLVQ
jgi:hypothetical protein